jgi:hypothetical protein
MRSASAILLLLVCVAATASADDPDPVILSVGKTELKASEVSARLGALHEFERKSFGSNDAEVKRAFVQQKLVPQALAAEEARQKGFDKEPPVVKRVNELLAQKLKDSIMAEVDATLTDAEIRAYCEAKKKANAPDAGTRGAVTDCKRDHLSYRIALRREKASAQMSELRAKLKKERVRGVDYELLNRPELAPRSDAPPKSSH